MEDKKPLPLVQVVAVLGHYKGATSAEIDRIRLAASKTYESFYLPKGNLIQTRFDHVDRYCVVRENQLKFYSEDTMEMNAFKVIAIPDEHGTVASNRREWIRAAKEITMPSGSFRLNIDSDFQEAAINAYYGVNQFDVAFSDADSIAALIGTSVLHMQHYGTDFAGFRLDRFNRPGVIPGLYASFEHFKEGRWNFKEGCTIESSSCPGKYPINWDFHEGAYRILDTWRNGGKTGIFGPSMLFGTRDPEVYEAAKSEYTRRLCDEFNKDGADYVLQGNGRGLNLRMYGNDRNRKRKK